MRLVVCLAFFITISVASANDLFIGTFESETRENFGTGTPGEYRIEIVPISKDKYMATIHHLGRVLEEQQLTSCPVEAEDYLDSRPAGRAEVLCHDRGSVTPHGVISYSENGIVISRVKPKYAKNRDLAKQEGLKPGDPSLRESRHYKAKYYAHVGWFFCGFRKVHR